MAWRIRLDQIRELIKHALHHDRRSRELQGLPERNSRSQSSDAYANDENQADDLKELHLHPCCTDLFIYHDILATVTDPGSPNVMNATRSQGRLVIGREEVYVIGLNNELFDLVRRVSNLHSRALDAATPTGAIICEALEIWNHLNEWAPGSPSTAEALASSAYKYALFVWLFFILYPDGIDAERLQEAVREGISNMR